MDLSESTVDRTKIQDVAEEIILDADVVIEARAKLFDEILEQLELCDLFSNTAFEPTIFTVYAHRNDAVNLDAHDNCVHELIRWLHKIKAGSLSDKSPLPPLPSTEQDASPQRNIIANQIRILPPGTDTKSKSPDRGVAKVIVCGSEVLEHYCMDVRASRYIDHVVELCKSQDSQSQKTLESRVEEFVHRQTAEEWFHHVLTEIAFLRFRKHKHSRDHGMVPVALDGVHLLRYLSVFGETDLTLKLKSPTPPAMHALFFKLLEQLYVNEKDLFEALKGCYNGVVEELKLGVVDHLTKTSFDNCLRLKINEMYRRYWSIFSTAIRNGRYVAYAGKLGKYTFQVVEKAKEEERLRILHWVSKISVSKFHGMYRGTSTTRRLNGTCDWVIRDERFHNWHNSENSEILSLCGSMGTGKTYATSRVIDWIGSSLEASDYDEAFAYFYCFKQDDKRRKAIKVLRSIVRQVAIGPWNRREDNLELDDNVRKIYEKHIKDQFYDDVFEWKECLLALLRRYPRTTIVLDALDECMEDDRKVLLDLFTDLVSRSHDNNTVKIFLSTRPEADLKKWLQIHHIIPMQEQCIAVDIAAFVRAKVEQERKWSRWKPDFREHVVETLVNKSQNMFLFAKLQIDRLLKHMVEDSDGVQKDLETLPNGLSAAYEAIYKTATETPANKRFTDRALRWVLCSARPLTSDELLFAICQDPEADAITQPRSDVDEEFILELCHNLLILDHSGNNCGARFSGKDSPSAPVFRVAHQGVAEFFENHAFCGNDPAHYEVGAVCLRIVLDTFRGGLRSDDRYECPCRRDLGASHWSTAKHFELETPLTEYANYAWPTHVRAQEHCETHSVDELARTLEQFLGQPKEGSLVYARWLAHIRLHGTPLWSMFARRKMPKTLNGHDMPPISLACYLGLDTVLTRWMDSLSHNIWFRDENWVPWENAFWRLPHGRPRCWSLVAIACAHNEADILKSLLNLGFSVNASKEDEVPPIVSAAIGNSGDAAKELINRGVELCSPSTKWHDHVLHSAIECNSLEVIGPLLDELMHQPQEVERILACVEIRNFHSAEAIMVLVDKGVNVNTPLRDGTLLAAAAFSGWEVVAGHLLKNGADVNMQFDGFECEWTIVNNAFEAAVLGSKSVSMPRLLIKHQACVSTSAVAFAFQNLRDDWRHPECSEMLQLVLQEMPDPDKTYRKDNDHITCALVEAVWEGRVNDVLLLIKRRAHVKLDVGGKAVDTLETAFEAALCHASYQEYPTELMVEALVNVGGASFDNLKGDSLNNALAAVAWCGSKDRVRILLEKGADPISFCGHRWTTALNAAADSTHSQSPHIVGMLLDNVLGREADINIYLSDSVGPVSQWYRLTLDYPLWKMLEGSEVHLNIRLESASVLLSKGAVWDIDIVKWRKRLETIHNDFSQQKEEDLDRLQQDFESNRYRFFKNHPEAAFDEIWRIKDLEEGRSHSTTVQIMNSISHILRTGRSASV